MAKILNKFMEYIGFGKDDVEYDEEPEDGLRETAIIFFWSISRFSFFILYYTGNAAFCQREMLSAFPESIAER